MTTDRTSPPYAADELTTLRWFLDHYRATLRRQAQGLDAEQLTRTLPPSPVTLGGLLKHLAYVEHWWFTEVLHGRPATGVWADVDWEADADWDWHSAADDSPEELDALLVEEIARADAAIDDALADGGGLDRLAVRPRGDGSVASLRWILVHMIEEYARHCGHADLVRESVDGARNL
ncbi:DinB family protein [Nocardioides sp. SYSU D00065]|uniref:DinB family protein n=1 Tax=Nocardioides sp. SYSU D00065 TaxID=2817378 RepID=UPI001B3259C6|nr:DinB family protein [Nocardioides sp. SYSU D00065]